MEVKMVPIGSVTLDPANARTHPVRNLEAIKASLLRFGQQKPIVVDAKGIVRAGNGTVAAAQALGWTEILAVQSDLASPAELAAFAIADNRSAELAEWDYQALAEQLRGLSEEGFPVKELGWEDWELDPLLKADWTPPEIDPDAGADAGGPALVVELDAAQAEAFRRAADALGVEVDGSAVLALSEAFLASRGPGKKKAGPGGKPKAGDGTG